MIPSYRALPDVALAKAGDVLKNDNEPETKIWKYSPGGRRFGRNRSCICYLSG